MQNNSEILIACVVLFYFKTCLKIVNTKKDTYLLHNIFKWGHNVIVLLFCF